MMTTDVARADLLQRPDTLRRLARATSAAITSLAVAGLAAAAEAGAGAPQRELTPGAAIQQDLRSFNTLGTVLHIAAHPDDENTALITYMARGRGYRMAYLSLTRGDGGQNEIGPEFDEKLGVARTQELLAARRLDGGRQFFTRAIDFGYSKTVEETLRFWDRDQVLADVVRVVRQFRPDVIVTRFPATGGGTHGHHTASGLLGVEAFKLAGDPKAYPEQLQQGLTVWQPKRVVYNTGGGGRGGAAPKASPSAIRVDIGGNDPVTGESFGAIASRSRGQHITQGFGNFGGRGGSGGSNEQSFTVVGGEPATKDIMEGVDVTWGRVAGGAEITALTEAVIAQFKGEDPGASVPALLAIRKKVATLPSDPLVDDKRAQLERILQACLGLIVEARATKPEIVPGEELIFNLGIRATGTVPVKLLRARIGPAPAPPRMMAAEIGANRPFSQEMRVATPDTLPLTHPYWLRADGSSGIFRVDDPKLLGRADNPPAFSVECIFEVGGQELVVAVEPVHVPSDAKEKRRRRVDFIPPVSLRFAAEVSVFTPGATRPVTVDIVAARANTSGTLRLDLPAEWKVSPASQSFRLAQIGEKGRVIYNVTSPAKPVVGRMTASAEVNGKRYGNDRLEINYAHIPLQLLQPPARARLASFEYTIRGKNVGYLPGAGDNVAECIEQMGYTVTQLTGGDLTPEKLHRFDAVVIGVRAFNERQDLAATVPGLFAYVENGGTVIAQYNRPNGLVAQNLGPYALSIQGSAPDLRVTDEKAPVAVLQTEHPVVNQPNKISDGDFTGWVQERGAYFPSNWDKASYVSIFAMSDPGEAPLNSSVLVARHGKGYYVYTGLAFFRQLPAGVPGAYRLFANLVSLGK